MIINFERQLMQNSAKLEAEGKSIPHGYVLDNGVVTVYREGGKVSNNFASLELAKAQLPNLITQERPK